MSKKCFSPFLFLILLTFNITGQSLSTDSAGAVFKVWSVEKGVSWYKSQPWIIGADFIPCTAINQLEKWQKNTFDTLTIDSELGWTQNIGFNTVRVYLHSVAW